MAILLANSDVEALINVSFVTEVGKFVEDDYSSRTASISYNYGLPVKKREVQPGFRAGMAPLPLCGE